MTNIYWPSSPSNDQVRLEGTEISTSSVTSSSEWWRRQVRIINTPEDVSLREIFRITDRFGSIERIEVENISSGNKVWNVHLHVAILIFQAC